MLLLVVLLGTWLCGSTAAAAPAEGDGSDGRYAEGNLLVSDELPAIRVRLDEAFTYVGRFEFTLGDVAAGERFIFVDAEETGIERMFIAQFEGFLPTSDEIYRYRFDDALVFGGHRFRQNTYAYSQRLAERERPEGEAALTAEFLRQRGYLLADEWMMSRFVTVPDEAKRHELILFYLEPVESSGHELDDLYEDDRPTPLWIDLSAELTARSLAGFAVE